MPQRLTETGQLALHTALRLRVPGPYHRSFITTGSTRETHVDRDAARHHYPKRYAHDGALRDHLRFALRHEPLDRRLLAAAFDVWGEQDITDWVRHEPTGRTSRRAWFLFETLTGSPLPLPDASSGPYAPALDEKREHVATRRNSPRHRVIDNLLGTGAFGVTVRRTPALDAYARRGFDVRARDLLNRYDPALLARAVAFLYTSETLSSFQIEREQPDKARERRFVRALRDAAKFDPLEDGALRELQRQIVDASRPSHGWREEQVFVGETVGWGQEDVHFIAPRPRDVPSLMQGWTAMTARLLADPHVDPVVAAAAIGFAFVFVHPFPDGNGRLHRFLIHHVLEKRKFSPPGAIFPISASILRDRPGYDDALETFSDGVMAHLDFDLDPDELTVDVRGESAHLYRHFDATPLAEYLYARIEDALERDFVGELEWLSRFDRIHRVAYAQDIPDALAKKLVRYLMEQRGRLSNNKRPQFADIEPEKLALVEARAREVFADEEAEPS